MSESLNLVALHVVYLAACLGVVAAVICRVDEMQSKRNKVSWWVMYCAYAVYALVVLLETLATRQWNVLYLLGLAALALNLGTTMKSWAGGKTPRMSCKPECGP